MEKQHGSRLIKNSVFSIFNRLFMMVTGWVISIWVARQLGPSNYGVFTLVLWFAGTFSWVVGMGLTHAVTKFVAEHQGMDRDESIAPIVIFVLKVEVVFSLLVTGVLVFLRVPVADFFFSPRESFLFFLAFLGLVPGVVTAIFSATIQGIQKFEYFTIASLVVTPLSFSAKIVVLLTDRGIEGLLMVMLVFSFVNVLFYYVVLRREGIHFFRSHPGMGAPLKKRLLRYNGSVFAILLIDKIVWDKSENFFLGRFCNAVEVGYYNLGFNIAKRFTSMLPETFWQVLFPAMSNYFGSGDKEKMRRLFFVSTRYLAFATYPVAVAGIILAYPIIHYLYGHEFIGAQRVLQVIFFASLFSSLTNPGSAILYGYEKQAFIYKFGAVCAVVNILLDILLIRRYGALGAAICYAVTTILGSVVGLIYTCTTMKLSYPFVSLFKIIFSTIIMGIVMELIVLQNRELIGCFLACMAGGGAYLVCALILGTFEEEDYHLLRSIKNVVPQRGKGAVDAVVDFIAQFKNGNGSQKDPD